MLMAFQTEEKKVASAVCIKLIAICVLRNGGAVLGRWSIQARKGTYVLEVNSGSHGDSAGFISGDCILEVEGTNISTSADIPRSLRNMRWGTS